jgi:hypothetical protein
METVEQLVEHLQALRREVDEANIRLMREARKIELGWRHIWKPHYQSFDSLLEDGNICKSRRYRDFLAAEENLGSAVVDAMGLNAAIESVKIQDPVRLEKYVEAATKRAEVEEVPWSEETADKQRKSIAGQPPKDSRYNKKADREAELKAEVIRLKQQIRVLEADVRDRDVEIAKLKKKLETKLAG